MGSEPAEQFELVLLLLAAAVVLEVVARRMRLPPAGALVLGGIVLALIPGTPQIELDPDLIMVLFLPPLLQASAYFTSWRDFRADLRIITQLAVGAVLFTTLVVGWVTHLLVPSMPLAACFVLGAIVSPPDAVAAKTVLRGLPLPRRMVVLLEGESLVNDASGLVLYRFAVAAALTGAFDLGQAAVSFIVVAAGGLAFGVGCGWLVTYLYSKLRDPALSITVSFLGAWVAYIGADKLHVSGVLATVACGLVTGLRQHHVIDAGTRLRARATWDAAVFVLESVVFILIGLALRGLLQRLGGWDAAIRLAPAIIVIVLAVVLSRFAWIVPTTYAVRALLPRLRRRDPYPPISVPIVMSWAGMRGVVSLAAALALPSHFPDRDFILAATFAVILVTVLLQGATLAPLIRLTDPREFGQRRAQLLSESETKARMAQAQLKAVEGHAHDGDGATQHPYLVQQFTHRAQAAARSSEAAHAGARTEQFRVILSALAAGRAELLRLHREGRIDDAVLRELEQELDLEEMSAERAVNKRS